MTDGRPACGHRRVGRSRPQALRTATSPGAEGAVAAAVLSPGSHPGVLTYGLRAVTGGKATCRT